MCKAALAERRRLSRPQTADPTTGYYPPATSPSHAPASGSRHGGGGGDGDSGGGGGGGSGGGGGGRAERPSSALAAYACVWGFDGWSNGYFTPPWGHDQGRPAPFPGASPCPCAALGRGLGLGLGLGLGVRGGGWGWGQVDGQDQG